MLWGKTVTDDEDYVGDGDIILSRRMMGGFLSIVFDPPLDMMFLQLDWEIRYPVADLYLGDELDWGVL
jgi:hypothetical protein